jgi:hypothetical protein
VAVVVVLAATLIPMVRPAVLVVVLAQKTMLLVVLGRAVKDLLGKQDQDLMLVVVVVRVRLAELTPLGMVVTVSATRSLVLKPFMRVEVLAAALLTLISVVTAAEPMVLQMLMATQGQTVLAAAAADRQTVLVLTHPGRVGLAVTVLSS